MNFKKSKPDKIEKTKNTKEKLKSSLDLGLLPKKLFFEKNSFEVDSIHTTGLVVLDWPIKLNNLSILNGLTAFPGTKVIYDIESVPAYKAKEWIENHVRNLNQAIANPKISEWNLAEKQLELELLKNMRQNSIQGNMKFGKLMVTIYVSAPSKKRLDEEVEAVKRYLRSLEILVDEMQPYTKEFYKNLQFQNKDLFVWCALPMDQWVIGGLYPFHQTTLRDDSGQLLGETATGSPVVLDMWLNAPQQGRNSYSSVILGKTGSGKSATGKKLILHEYAIGTRQIIFDFEDEFGQFKTDNRGEYIYNEQGEVEKTKIARFIDAEIISGSGGTINNPQVLNPFDIFWNVPEGLEISKDLDWSLIKNTGLENHISSVLNPFATRLWNLTDEELGVWVMLVKKTYENFGIVSATNTNGLSREDFPIFSDVLKVIEEQVADVNASDNIRAITEKIQILLSGTLSGSGNLMWNGKSTIGTISQDEISKIKAISIDDADYANRISKKNNELLSKNVILKTKELNDFDPKLKDVQLMLLFNWVESRAFQDKTNRCKIHIDEAHLIMTKNTINAMKKIQVWFKRARKYHVGINIMTQNVNDLTNKDVYDLGKTILDDAQYVFIFHQENDAAISCGDFFGLNPNEMSMIQYFNPGECILKIGKQKSQIRIIQHDYEKELINT